MVREGGMGVQIMPEVWRTMKAIFSGVMSLAAIIRSPSFSREVESRTMMNSPFSGRRGRVSSERGWVCMGRAGRERMDGVLTEGGDCVFDCIEFVDYI